MPSYFIAQIDVHDPAAYETYRQGTAPLLERFSGRLLAAEPEPLVLEGEWPFSRTVLIEFPTMTDLENWYRSPEYQQLLAYREAAADGNSVAVRGRD